jgi:hypothetical protein
MKDAFRHSTILDCLSPPANCISRHRTSTPTTPSFYIKGIISYFLLAIAVSYGLVFCICETLVGRDGLFGFWSTCHFYAWIMDQVMGIKVIVEGAEHTCRGDLSLLL